MTDKKFILEDTAGKEITVFVRRDKRLKKSSRWMWQQDGTILLRVPYQLPNRMIGRLLDQIADHLEKQDRLAERRTDAELQQRAEYINDEYFDGRVEWKAIRWVGNMSTRYGSCTNGGTTDGHIRISDKIKHWPDWVIDYIIAHEMTHRLHDNHSKAFWATLEQAYPLTERARGFIRGISFAEGHPDVEE